MKHLGIALALLLVAGMVAATNTSQPIAPMQSADQSWSNIERLDLLRFKIPSNWNELTRREKQQILEKHALLLREMGLAFYETFPTDPRRWQVLLAMVVRPPRFITVYGVNIEKDAYDFVVDETAAIEWRTRLAQLKSELKVASDVPADVREAMDLHDLNAMSGDAMSGPIGANGKPGARPNLLAFQGHILAFAAKYPASSGAPNVAKSFMYAFEATHTLADSARAWSAFVDSENMELAEMAREKLRVFEALSGPMELAFTALDGSEIDLKSMRGKIVLVDFWATWCAPCIAEIPNLRKVYAAYHDQGFEIIGISCDIAPDAAKALGLERIARTGQQVLRFTEENAMPWPEHYEGRRHGSGGNSIAARFAVTGIPASFLIDQSGMVVAMNPRGEELDSAVKRLLKK